MGYTVHGTGHSFSHRTFHAALERAAKLLRGYVREGRERDCPSLFILHDEGRRYNVELQRRWPAPSLSVKVYDAWAVAIPVPPPGYEKQVERTCGDVRCVNPAHIKIVKTEG